MIGNKVRKSRFWKNGNEENKINLDDLQNEYIQRKENEKINQNLLEAEDINLMFS
jgi:hypothetical protein